MGLTTMPRTWVLGELVTPAMLNAEVRDPATAGAYMGTPRATVANGTLGTAVETRDAVLGDYVFTAVAGRRYEARLTGLVVAGGAVNNQVGVRIRNGGAATPAATSMLVASSMTLTPVAAAFFPLPIAGTFVPGAGVVTLSAFTVRLVGSGAGETPSGARELYAVDLGPA